MLIDASIQTFGVCAKAKTYITLIALLCHRQSGHIAYSPHAKSALTE